MIKTDSYSVTLCICLSLLRCPWCFQHILYIYQSVTDKVLGYFLSVSMTELHKLSGKKRTAEISSSCCHPETVILRDMKPVRLKAPSHTCCFELCTFIMLFIIIHSILGNICQHLPLNFLYEPFYRLLWSCVGSFLIFFLWLFTRL